MIAGVIALITGAALLAVVLVTEFLAGARGVETGCLPIFVGVFAVLVALAGLGGMGLIS